MTTGIIFDLDGLMINTEPLSLEAWQRCLAPYGARLTEQQYQDLIGQGHDDSIRYVIQQTGVARAYEALDRSFWEQLALLVDERLEPMPGLLPLLYELAGRGYLLGLASNSPIGHVRRATAKIGVTEYFTCMIGADQVERDKPAPDVYLQVARCLGLPPASCLAFEDSPTGVQAALAAGMRCVFIPNPDIEAPSLDGVEAVFHSLSALHDALDEVMSRDHRPGGEHRP